MNYYELLGIDADATKAQIKAAFRKKAQEHHPDKEGGDEDLFVEIKKAYEVLSDPDNRAHYDRYGVQRPTDDNLLKAKGFLSNLFQVTMNQGLTKYDDITKIMTIAIKAEETKSKSAVYNLQAERKKCLMVNHKLHPTTSDTLLIEMLRGRRRDVWRAYRDTQGILNVLSLATGLLAGYQYEVDVKRDVWAPREWGTSSLYIRG